MSVADGRELLERLIAGVIFVGLLAYLSGAALWWALRGKRKP